MIRPPERSHERTVATECLVELADCSLDSFGLAVPGSPNEKDDSGCALDAMGNVLAPLPQPMQEFSFEHGIARPAAVVVKQSTYPTPPVPGPVQKAGGERTLWSVFGPVISPKPVGFG
jgi:hypothetical protein